MGVLEAVPVARDCFLVRKLGDEPKLLTSGSTFNATELATLKEAREMLVAACPVDQISDRVPSTACSLKPGRDRNRRSCSRRECYAVSAQWPIDLAASRRVNTI